MIKPKLWKGNDLEGHWEFTLKVDGVRGLRDKDGNIVSRSGKPLHNLDHTTHTDFEVYAYSWERSVSMVRTHDSTPVDDWHIYSLDPLDKRLNLSLHINPTAD